MKEVKVREFTCPNCEKTILVTVIDPKHPFDAEELKEQAKLIKKGYDVNTISLEEARKEREWCFDQEKCKAEKEATNA